ncbi:MAG TPA: trypsin-like serine protease [Myxococcota bacterium]|nr:trypsin-like serine protease [Myxococcota bacterium]
MVRSCSLRPCSVRAALAFAGLGACVGQTAGCADVVEEPPPATRDTIIGGTVHSGHPAVGALAYAGSSFFCTGTLIAPRVVLTAAHCVMSGSGTVFRFGTSSWTPYAEIAVVGWRVPSQWGGGNFDYDIALAELQYDAPEAPAEINRAAANVAAGTSALFIGYGQTETGSSGTKRAVVMQIDWRGTYQFDYADSVHNTCYGDSGGPAFVTDGAGVERVVGVTSHGDANCAVNGTDTRVDAHQTWLDAQVAAIMGSGTASGGTSGGGTSGSGSGSGSGAVTTTSLCTAGVCGGQAAAGCWCDAACKNYGDCCSNACDVCGEGCAGGGSTATGTGSGSGGGTAADPCGGLTWGGTCDGTILSYCYDSTVYTVDCGDYGMTCGEYGGPDIMACD